MSDTANGTYTSIANATSATYAIAGDQSQVGKFFKVVVTGTDGALSTSAVTSAATAAVANVNDAPLPGTVAITGTVQEGGTLTATPTGFTDPDGTTPTYTYQWQMADTANGTYTSIANATSATYAIAGDQSQVGKFFKVVVTGTDGTLSTSAVTSAATAAVANVNDAPLPGTVAITGTVQEGGTLTATPTGFTDPDGTTPTYTYQWQMADTANGTYTSIANATSATYAIAGDQSQVGKFFKVVVTGTDGALSTSAVTSAATAAVANVNDAPVNTLPTALSVNEDTILSITGISVSDDDGNLASTKLTVVSGTLQVDLAGGATISAGTNNSATLTLSGTQTQINAALATLAYKGNANFNGNDTLTVLSTDSAENALTDSDSVSITVDAQAAVVTNVTDNISAEVTSGNIEFTVTFDEEVIGVFGTDNFIAINGSVTSVDSLGNNQYKVTVTPESGLATADVSLKLIGDGLSDSLNNQVLDVDLTVLASQKIDTFAEQLGLTLAATLAPANGLTASVTGLEQGATWQYKLNSGSWINGSGTTFTYNSTDLVEVKQTDALGNESDIRASTDTTGVSYSGQNALLSWFTTTGGLASGGVEKFVLVDGELERLHTFGTATTAQSFVNNSGGTLALDYLVVGGGGGAGAGGGVRSGGGGGGGDVKAGTFNSASDASHAVVVGAGGKTVANTTNGTYAGDGAKSTLQTDVEVGANGGKGGGNSRGVIADGYSVTNMSGHGGASGSNKAGHSWEGVGSIGGGGGGAGASPILATGSAGGAGIASSITGESLFYGGGGGAGSGNATANIDSGSSTGGDGTRAVYTSGWVGLRVIANSTTDVITTVFSTASTSADGSKIYLVYDDVLDQINKPDTSAFSVKVGGNSTTVSSLEIQGNIVVLTLANAVVSSQTVTVSYSDTTSGNDALAIQDLGGLDAAALVDQAVTNMVGVADSAAPTVLAATTGLSNTSNKLTLIYNEMLDPNNLPDKSKFVVTDGLANSKNLTVTEVSAVGGTLVLTVDGQIPKGGSNRVSVRYDDTTVGNDVNAIQDLSGNDAASILPGANSNAFNFADFSIANGTDGLGGGGGGTNGLNGGNIGGRGGDGGVYLRYDTGLTEDDMLRVLQAIENTEGNTAKTLVISDLALYLNNIETASLQNDWVWTDAKIAAVL
jgi:hypothetical protein